MNYEDIYERETGDCPRMLNDNDELQCTSDYIVWLETRLAVLEAKE